MSGFTGTPIASAINPVTRIPAARRDWTRLMAELGIRPKEVEEMVHTYVRR